MYHAVSWCQKCSGFFSTQHPSNILWSCWGPVRLSLAQNHYVFFPSWEVVSLITRGSPAIADIRNMKWCSYVLRFPQHIQHCSTPFALFLRFPEAALAKSQRTLGSHSVVASPESLSTTGRDHDLMSNKRRLNLLRRFFPCSDGQIPKDPIVIQCHTRKIRLLTLKPCVRESARCVSTGPRCIATIHNEWSVTNPAIRGQIGQVASA